MWTEETRQQALKRDGYRCTKCNVSTRLQVHHIVPIGEGGADTLDNAMTLCIRCHRIIEPPRFVVNPGYPQSPTIAIYEDTYEDLRGMAKYGDSMAELIRKCVEAYKKK